RLRIRTGIRLLSCRKRRRRWGLRRQWLLLALRTVLRHPLRARPPVGLLRAITNVHARDRIRPRTKIGEVLNLRPSNFPSRRNRIIIMLAHFWLGQDGVTQLNLLAPGIIGCDTMSF